MAEGVFVDDDDGEHTHADRLTPFEDQAYWAADVDSFEGSYDDVNDYDPDDDVDDTYGETFDDQDWDDD